MRQYSLAQVNMRQPSSAWGTDVWCENAKVLGTSTGMVLKIAAQKERMAALRSADSTSKRSTPPSRDQTSRCCVFLDRLMDSLHRLGSCRPFSAMFCAYCVDIVGVEVILAVRAAAAAVWLPEPPSCEDEEAAIGTATVL